MRVEYEDREAYLVFECGDETCDGEVRHWATNRAGEYSRPTSRCDECNAEHRLTTIKTGEGGDR